MMLGKSPTIIDPRTLMLDKYLMPAQLPQLPMATDWTPKTASKLQMFKNDQIGDCTCAAAGNMIINWTGNAGVLVTPSEDQIVGAYSAITGYPKAGDNGAAELRVLNYWRSNGIAGHKIGAYAKMTPSNANHVMLATYLLGGCYIGIGLPLSAQDQIGKVWRVTGDTQSGASAFASWGGHAVPIIGYTQYDITVATWGALQVMTWDFYNAYCDEAYALFSSDWIENTGSAPNGINATSLQADLSLLN